MTGLEFTTDWQDGEGLRGAELAATFASLRIDVQGRPLTQVLDHRARTVRDHIFVPLYPIAEWLASNWWFLVHEHENRVKREDSAFRHRHSLGTSTDGYALPNLTIVASGGRTTLTWGDQEPGWTAVRFLERGSATVERDQFIQGCTEFIDRVIRRLISHDILSTFLQDEWDAIQNADEDEHAFCEMSAGLGWDPYDLDDSRRRQVAELAERLGELRGEAVAVIDSVAPSEDCSALLAAIEAAKPNELPLPRLEAVAQGIEFRQRPPWDLGYELARRARSEFGLDGQPIASTESLAHALGQDFGALRRATKPLECLSSLELVDGVVTQGTSGTVALGFGERGEAGMRFLLCRALSEVIYSRGDALLTKGATARQRLNRAFAAEFLAPSRSLAKRIVHPTVDGEQVDDLAEEFGVSTRVIQHQLENHRIAGFAHN